MSVASVLSRRRFAHRRRMLVSYCRQFDSRWSLPHLPESSRASMAATWYTILSAIPGSSPDLEDSATATSAMCLAPACMMSGTQWAMVFGSDAQRIAPLGDDARWKILINKQMCALTTTELDHKDPEDVAIGAVTGETDVADTPNTSCSLFHPSDCTSTPLP